MPGPLLTSVATSALRLPINFFPVLSNNNINLFDYADKARWGSGLLTDADNTTNDTTLPWMGSLADSNGFVRLDDNVVMENGQAYRVLRTHPKWVNNGTIKGWFPWVTQNGTGVFKAQVGFVQGAANSSGVTFQVWVHYHVSGVEHWENVVRQQKTYNGQLQDITADLSKWASQEISIELRVDAGATSICDWAAWLNPRIEVTPPVVVKVPGPIINNVNPGFFDDRYDASKKWFLPDFALKQPLVDNFKFSCVKNPEPDADGNATYTGEVNFTVVKNTPAAVAPLVVANPTVSYTEIPLSNFNINFVIALSQPIAYAGTFTQTNNEYTFTLKPDSLLKPKDQQDYLQKLFNFLSNRDNAAFCTLSFSGTYMGYIPKIVPVQLNQYQDTFRRSRLQFQPAAGTASAKTAFRPQMFMHVIGDVVAKPVAREINIIDHPLIDYTTNDAISFVKVIPSVSYPCSGVDSFPNNYIVKNSNAAPPVVFGCHLPFGNASATSHVYEEVFAKDVILTNFGINNIYRNTYNYNYLVIPQQYVIMLEQASDGNQEDPLVPAAYLNTVIDDTNADNCTATFKFHIAPNISAYQEWMIKKIIFNNSPAGQYKTFNDINIDFPEMIHQPGSLNFAKVKDTQITYLGAYSNGVAGSKYFQLEFQGVAIGDGSAATIATTIKGQAGNASVVNTIAFEIDSDRDSLPQSAINLSLKSIIGNGMMLQKNNADNQVYLLNRTLYDINVSNLAVNTDTSVTPPVTGIPLFVVKQNTAVSASDVQPPQTLTADNFTLIVPQYGYVANQDYFNTVLTEIRIDAQRDVSDSFIVTNNTGLFTMYHISQIDVTLYILAADETDFTKAFKTISLSIVKDGIINNVPFTLPVGQYISKWSVVYATNITFTDGTIKQNNVQVVKDINSIGKVINLTVSSLNLSVPS